MPLPELVRERLVLDAATRTAAVGEVIDYSQLSDFEINRMVGDIIFKGLWACKPETSGNNTNKWYYGNTDTTFEPLNPLPDYCNNPSDAWPIIVDNKISLTCHQSRGEWSAVFNTENICFHANNPLRAAMIVFLMMQENQNG
ncbi:phage protein NinX family protein [Escherichia coli]